jgi:serine phosphatase RsbU (regulator of sigma subunit)
MSHLVEEWVKLKEVSLEYFAHLAQEHPGEPLPELEQGTIFFKTEEGVYTTSSSPVLIGKTAPPFGPEKLQIAFLVAGYAPSIVLRKGEMGLSFNAGPWLEAIFGLEKGTTNFSLSLVDRKGQSLLKISNLDPNVSEKQLEQRLFSLPDASFDLLIAVDRESLEHRPGFHLLNTLLLLVFLFLFVGGGSALWLSHRMAKPLKQLHRVMDRVQQGEVSAIYAVDRLGFEINQLGKHFNQMLKSLLQQKLGRELLAKELAIGHEIQKSLFPKEMPDLQGIEVAAGFLPAREVAGDFYDLFVPEKDQLFIAIADASDKGISACLYSLLLRCFLRSQLQTKRSFAGAIDQANTLFCQDTKETGNFATAWIGLYNLGTKQLTYCNAGHPPALLLRLDGTTKELSHGMGALGVSEFLGEVETAEVQLEPGDRLFLYTDGVVEAQDTKGRFFGKEALLEKLSRTQNKTPRESVDFLLEEVARFSQGADRADDLTLVCAKIE